MLRWCLLGYPATLSVRSLGRFGYDGFVSDEGRDHVHLWLVVRPSMRKWRGTSSHELGDDVY